MSILAHYNKEEGKALVSVESIVREHWATYGRNYYVRYDYEGVDKIRAEAMVTFMTSSFAAVTGEKLGGGYLFTDGSRVIFRLSGTAGSGATVRMYLEKYQPDKTMLGLHPLEALGELVEVALKLSNLQEFTGRTEPTVIT
eukprot:evm.model.NODE_13683_length_3710_cov_32.593800.2